MTNNLTSQAAVMKLGGVPNDIVSNFNPLFIVLLIPIVDQLIYPFLRKLGIKFTPIKRITCGFFLASSAMISACVTQYYIYQMSPCGNHANSCEDENGNTLGANISVWVQLLPYGLIGFSEIMASVTSLEYAFTKAPTNMRSTVQAVALFMNALSSALAQALVALAEDPLLVWNYGLVAVLAAVCRCESEGYSGREQDLGTPHQIAGAPLYYDPFLLPLRIGALRLAFILDTPFPSFELSDTVN
jgi:POT family proton-dependent oligopeptide transporter